MPSAASMESLPRKYQGRRAEERFLVLAMLQLASRFSIEARHRRNERSGGGTRRPLSLHRIFGQQNQTDLAMLSRTFMDSHARIRTSRNVVPGLRSQPAPPIGSPSENRCKQGRGLSFTDLCERADGPHMVLRRRTSLERDTRQSEARFMVSKMRGHSPQK